MVCVRRGSVVVIAQLMVERRIWVIEIQIGCLGVMQAPASRCMQLRVGKCGEACILGVVGREIGRRDFWHWPGGDIAKTSVRCRGDGLPAVSLISPRAVRDDLARYSTST